MSKPKAVKTNSRDYRKRLDEFMQRALGIMDVYMDRLEQCDVIEASDSRACSTVVKAMLDETLAAGKFIAGMTEETVEEDPLEHIDDHILDEIIEHVIKKTSTKEKRRQTVRSAKPRISRTADAGV